MHLLLQLLPHVYGETNLALKGGTAINVFLRNLPRFSVDIDLAYVSFSGHEQALKEIDASLCNIKAKIGSAISNAAFVLAGNKGKLLVKQAGVNVQIEVTTGRADLGKYVIIMQVFTMQKRNKLNKLQHILPEPLLATVPWLESRGYSRTLLSKYAAAGWLVQPARGVYHRPGFRLSWESVVTSLQSLLGYPLVVGGRTALELQGHSHYISPKIPYLIHLYGPKPPPGWLHKLDLDKKFFFHRVRRLFPGDEYARTKQQFRDWNSAAQRFSGSLALPEQTKELEWSEKQMPLLVSTPARAAFEHLDDIPGRERFDEVGYILEKLAWLDPEEVEELLCQCRSVKVKRLFLWFAERHQQSWFEKIDLKKIDLGSGKRVLVDQDGCLDPKYQITFPKYMLYEE